MCHLLMMVHLQPEAEHKASVYCKQKQITVVSSRSTVFRVKETKNEQIHEKILEQWVVIEIFEEYLPHSNDTP